MSIIHKVMQLKLNSALTGRYNREDAAAITSQICDGGIHVQSTITRAYLLI